MIRNPLELRDSRGENDPSNFLVRRSASDYASLALTRRLLLVVPTDRAPRPSLVWMIFDPRPAMRSTHGQTVRTKIARGEQSKVRRQERKTCRRCGLEFESRRKRAKHVYALAQGSEQSASSGKDAEKHSPAKSAPLTVSLERVASLNNSSRVRSPSPVLPVYQLTAKFKRLMAMYEAQSSSLKERVQKKIEVWKDVEVGVKCENDDEIAVGVVDHNASTYPKSQVRALRCRAQRFHLLRAHGSPS